VGEPLKKSKFKAGDYVRLVGTPANRMGTLMSDPNSAGVFLGQRPETVMLQFEKVIGMIERLADQGKLGSVHARKRHGRFDANSRRAGLSE
jgi:hypothetical protein